MQVFIREMPEREYGEGARDGWEGHQSQCKPDLEGPAEGEKVGGSILDCHVV